MKWLSSFLRTTAHRLGRGGQQVWVALACITFGVMSLVAMLLFSGAIAQGAEITPGERLGADLNLSLKNGSGLKAEDLAELEGFKEAGLIQEYTLLGYSSGLVYQRPGSGEVLFNADGIGMDPQVYPLVGTIELERPGNVGLATLLETPGDLVVTRDLVEKHKLQVGDALQVSDLSLGVSLVGRVRGIASDTPNHVGSKVYYNLETAARLSPDRTEPNLAMATAADPQEVKKRLDDSPWRVVLAEDLAKANQPADDFIAMALRGAGMLGLMVGGIGIANTMQVLMRRRQREVAVLKTLGYTQADLLILFASEALGLGVVGSLIGTGLGWLISFGLLDLLLATGSLLVRMEAFSPLILAAGLLAGVASTLIFALWSIVRTGQVQPMALLRNQPVETANLPWLQGAGLAAALGLPFVALTSLVMGSIWKGLGVLLFALFGLAGLGALLGGTGWAVTRLLAWRSLPLVYMAQSSLRRRGPALIFAMIALFAGILTLAFGVVVSIGAEREMSYRRPDLSQGYDLAVVAPASLEAQLLEQAEALKIEKSTLGYSAAVRSIRGLAVLREVELEARLVGRAAHTPPPDFKLSGAEWGSEPEGVYVPDFWSLPDGAQVEVTTAEGNTHKLSVVGSYELDSRYRLRYENGLLMSTALSQRLAPAQTLTYYAKAPGGNVQPLLSGLGEALPQAIVIDLESYAGRYIATYENLFWLAAAMSGLALLAGMLLVANSVSLSMLDRRYEIGVLKAMGYARRHILTSLTVEYSLVAVISTGAALAAVKLWIFLVSFQNELVGQVLRLDPPAITAIASVGIGLTLLAALGTAWKPVAASPAGILTDRE